MFETSVRLGRKDRTIKEPVFKDLRRILELYNAMWRDGAVADLSALDRILSILTQGKVRLNQVTEDELRAFLPKLMTVCGFKAAPEGATGVKADWEEIYAHVSICMHYTWDYVDERMTLGRLHALSKYLQKHPPTHQLAAACLGYEYKERKAIGNFLADLRAQAKAQGLLN